MKTGKKALLLALCAVLLVAATVMGTMAYLTASDEVVNTFTVGDVKISLDEAKVNTNGEPVNEKDNVVDLKDAPRVDKNDYKLMPGHTYVKDPTVTVKAKSEESYVRMRVTVNDVTKLKAAFGSEYVSNDIFLLQKLVDWDPATTMWEYKSYESGTDGKSGIYEFCYKGTVKYSDSDTKLPALFTEITIPGEIGNTALANLNGVTITVVADAIQADGFADANAAWTAFKA